MSDATGESGRRHRPDGEDPPWWMNKAAGNDGGDDADGVASDGTAGAPADGESTDPDVAGAGLAGAESAEPESAEGPAEGLAEPESAELESAEGPEQPAEAEPSPPEPSSPEISSPEERVMTSPTAKPAKTTSARRRDPVGATIRGIGQLLITAGVVVLLFVVYELWVTNIFGEQKQAEAMEQLDEQWNQDIVTAPPGDPAVVTQSGGTVVVTGSEQPTAPETDDRELHYDTTEGAGFAKMYVPAFGADFVLAVIEGVTQADLYAGPGHYPDSQYPGQAGNFALAGHRVNKGAPFDDLGLLSSCDAVVIETRDDWYVYRVLPMEDEVATWDTVQHAHCDGVDVQTGQYAGVYGREITDPHDIEQVRPVPHVGSLAVPEDAQKLITLTTCHPKFSDRERMIIHGILVKSYPKADGFLPPELQETS